MAFSPLRTVGLRNKPIWSATRRRRKALHKLATINPTPSIPGLTTLLWQDDFNALSLRSGGGEAWGGFGSIDADFAAGHGVYEGTPWFINDPRGSPSAQDHQRSFFVNPQYRWGSGYAGQAAIVDGKLRLRTEPTPSSIAAQLPTNPDTGAAFDYVSPYLTTRHSVKVKVPFYTEAKIKFPRGKAVWPAYWLFGAGRSPYLNPQFPGVEIDVAEYFPDPIYGDRSHQMSHTLHWNTAAAPNGTYNSSATLTSDIGVDYSLDYHVYGAHVTATTIAFYIDGVKRQEIAVPAGMPMDQYFYIVLDNGLGNTEYTGYVDGTITTSAPKDMLVEYVSIYGSPSTTPIVLDTTAPAVDALPTYALAAYNGNDPTVWDQYDTWLGRPADLQLASFNQSSWSAFQSSISYATNLFGARRCIWSVPLACQFGTLPDVVAGTHDAKFLACAQAILAKQPGTHPILIRTGWEFNLLSQEQRAFNAAGTPTPTVFVSAFQRFVNIFRSVSNRFRYIWCPNAGDMTANGLTVTDCYPGDSYVDIVAVDLYFNNAYDNLTANGSSIFSYRKTQTAGLDWLVGFASTHGKPWALGEWGVNDNGATGFVTDMCNYIRTYGALYHGYWNSNSVIACKISDGSLSALGAIYRAKFGRAVITSPLTPTATAGSPFPYTLAANQAVTWSVVSGDPTILSGGNTLTFPARSGGQTTTVQARAVNGDGYDSFATIAVTSTATRAWVPTDLGAGLIDWFDASDSATVTRDGSNLVSKWASKVGSGRSYDQTGGPRPTYSATARNGLPGIITNGASTDMVRSVMTGIPAGQAAITQAFQLYGDPSLSTGFKYFYSDNDATSSATVGRSIGTSSGVLRVQGSAGLSGGGSTLAGSDRSIVVSLGAGASQAVRASQDGNTVVTGSIAVSATTMARSVIGAQVAPGAGAVGNYAAVTFQEMILLNRVVTATEEDLIHGYLAWKWGRQAFLPSGHPYKSAAPTVAV